MHTCINASVFLLRSSCASHCLPDVLHYVTISHNYHTVVHTVMINATIGASASCCLPVALPALHNDFFARDEKSLEG